MASKDQIQEEALDAVDGMDRAGIACSVGVGKTLIGLKHMNKHYSEHAKFLIVAPKLSVLDEWKQQAVIHGLAHLLPHMHYTTYLSLDKQDLDYDVVYLDEVHSIKYTQGSWLLAYKGKILGLTGTPPKYEKSEKGKMVNKFCPIVYTYVTDDAVEDQILNDYRIIVHTLNLNQVKNMPMHTKGATWFTSEQLNYDYWTGRLQRASTAKELQIMRVMRMKALQGFPSKDVLAKTLLTSSTEKTLLFANTQDQADDLCSHSYHSGNPNSEQNLIDFKSGVITKLSCVQQLSEGVNIPGLKIGIIMHSFGNERKSSQRIGRMMRLNPNDTATIHMLCYKGTVDEQWCRKALEDYDQSKITWK